MSYAKQHENGGFTLIEVLVALAILAIAASGLLYATNENIKNASYLESRTLATWVAENTMAELLLLNNQDRRSGTQSIIFADRAWDVRVEIGGADSSQLKRVSVTVNLQRGYLQRSYASSSVQSELVAYIGEHR